jgi:hypothetical protein
MQISGFLPAPVLPAQPQGQSTTEKSPTQNSPDTQHKPRRAPVEYVFDGEVIDDAQQHDSTRRAYSQTIDPANQSAISSYAEQQSELPRQGRLLDIFI